MSADDAELGSQDEASGATFAGRFDWPTVGGLRVDGWSESQGGATAAAMLALYIHLIRRNGLSLGGLGFRQSGPRMLHLLWQIPSAIVISACLQGLFFAAL